MVGGGGGGGGGRRDEKRGKRRQDSPAGRRAAMSAGSFPAAARPRSPRFNEEISPGAVGLLWPEYLPDARPPSSHQPSLLFSAEGGLVRVR